MKLARFLKSKDRVIKELELELMILKDELKTHREMRVYDTLIDKVIWFKNTEDLIKYLHLKAKRNLEVCSLIKWVDKDFESYLEANEIIFKMSKVQYEN